MLTSLRPSRSIILRLAETAVYAVLGGLFLNHVGLPAGFLSGAMLFTAIAALSGRPVVMPMPVMRVIFVAMGITLGGVVTPETLRSMTTWPLSIAALGVTSVVSTFAGYLYLKRVHGWDPVSAMLASTPGSLSQALIHATDEKADVRGIAIVQTVRSSILSIGVPVILTLLGTVDAPRTIVPPSTAANPALEFAILILSSTVCSIVLHKLSFPGGIMFGAMMASAILHGTGLIHAQTPWWAASAVMSGLGAIIGTRFANTGVRVLLGFLVAALGMFAVVFSVSMALAFAVATALSLEAADVVVSYTPGALDVMMMLSLALHLDPVFVGAHHLSRFVMVSVAMPAGLRAVKSANKITPRPSPGE
jgi:membrane AbrB-like protein